MWVGGCMPAQANARLAGHCSTISQTHNTCSRGSSVPPQPPPPACPTPLPAQALGYPGTAIDPPGGFLQQPLVVRFDDTGKEQGERAGSAQRGGGAVESCHPLPCTPAEASYHLLSTCNLTLRPPPLPALVPQALCGP